MTVFDVASDALFASVLGEIVTYTHVASDIEVSGVRAIVRDLEEVGDHGQVQITQDAMQVEIMAGDLPVTPARRDRIARANGEIFTVQTKPHLDRDRRAWICAAYRLP
jgi:phosphate uptake regulator